MSTAPSGRWRTSVLERSKPAPVRVTEASLVERRPLNESERLPVVIQPHARGVNLPAWTSMQRRELEDALVEHGGILFRGFTIADAAEFQACASAMSGTLLDYAERAAPRKEVKSHIYTSTEYPADRDIPLHHEMSYSHAWPMKIWFYCDRPAATGGSTPICDDRKVIHLLDPSIKALFGRKQVMYVRNYGQHLDLPWQEAFQAQSRAEVERYCREAGMQWEWRADGSLRTRQVRPATIIHPRTGDTVWFNHAHLFHSSNLDADVRQTLTRDFAAEDLPRNAFFGDGSPIEDAMLEEIRAVYRTTAVRFSWRAQDLLMLDNVLTSHGREPFEGPRNILVAMAELHTS